MDSERSINLFEIKKDRLLNYLLNNYFFNQFFNNFLILLLCQMNIFDFFDTGDFFKIFVVSQSTEILFKLNFWFGVYVSYIRNHTRLSTFCDRTAKNLPVHYLSKENAEKRMTPFHTQKKERKQYIKKKHMFYSECERREKMKKRKKRAAEICAYNYGLRVFTI